MADTMDTAKRHWQDICNFLLGVWLIFSPWIFGFTHVKYAAGNSYILGAIIGVAAASVLVAFHEWEEWVNMVLGLWLIVSPWILKFGTATVAAAAGLLALVGLGASLVPARKASSVDPLQALRAE